MKRLLLACLVLCLAGCAGVRRFKAVHDAVNQGRIEGLSASNKLEAIVWGVPDVTMGPYSTWGGTMATTTNSAGTNCYYVFYLGRSRETKTWEVFAAMEWRDGKWVLVPVKLPQSEK
jgi:hypothetical protein